MTGPLDIPTCADCEMIGLTMPDLLVRMETELGVETTAAFLAEWGGRTYGIRRTAARGSGAAFDEVNAWLLEELGHGRVQIPFGPFAWKARLAWTIYNALAEGMSHDRIARAYGVAMRNVTNHRRRFEARGLLRNSPAQGSPIPRGHSTQGH